MTVTGRWSADAPARDSLSVEGYFELLMPCDESRWFRMEATRTGIVIKSRSGAATTLGAIRLSVDGQRERGGFIKFALKGGNVTRTLHHLLVMHGHLGPQFADFVSHLDPVRFFSRAPGGVPLGFGDDGDNWISDYAVMRACLGSDPFAAFHAIYVHQLQRLVGWLVLPLDTRRLIPDGTSMWSRVPGISCRMDWGDVRLQQIETYF